MVLTARVSRRRMSEGYAPRVSRTREPAPLASWGSVSNRSSTSFVSAVVSSGPWRFTLKVPRIRMQHYGDEQIDWLGCVLPNWDETLPPPSPGMTCRFTFMDRCRREPPRDDLHRVLGDDRALLALLAWRGVKRVEWAGQRWRLAEETKDLGDGDRRVFLTALDSAGKVIHRWVLFDHLYQPSSEAIRRFLEHRQICPKPEEEEAVYAQAARQRQVALFCELKDGRPVPPTRGTVYALLPTGVTLPLGMHVQADWLLEHDPARTDSARCECVARRDSCAVADTPAPNSGVDGRAGGTAGR